MTYVMETLAENGDLVDVHYECGPTCQQRAACLVGAKWARGERVDYANGQPRFDFTTVICPETDYDVWCHVCGDFMWHGMNCECEDPTADREPVEVKEGELLG